MTEFFLVLAVLLAACGVIAALSLMVGLRELVDQQTRCAVALEAIAEAAGTIADGQLAEAEAAALRVLEDSRKTHPGEEPSWPPEPEGAVSKALGLLRGESPAFCFRCGKTTEACRCTSATSSSAKD